MLRNGVVQVLGSLIKLADTSEEKKEESEEKLSSPKKKRSLPLLHMEPLLLTRALLDTLTSVGTYLGYFDKCSVLYLCTHM